MNPINQLKKSVIILAFLAPMIIFAQDFDVAMQAYDRGDYAAALKEFRPLAEQGDPLAQGVLATMYRNGEGVPQDYSEALKWFRKSAKQNNPISQYNLGSMYANGNGVPQDYSEAVKWFRKSAEQNNSSAQYNLGLMYAKGQGVPQDYVQAHMWVNLAASTGLETAAEFRGAVASEMTSADISKAQEMARDWIEQHPSE